MGYSESGELKKRQPDTMVGNYVFVDSDYIFEEKHKDLLCNIWNEDTTKKKKKRK